MRTQGVPLIGTHLFRSVNETHNYLSVYYHTSWHNWKEIVFRRDHWHFLFPIFLHICKHIRRDLIPLWLACANREGSVMAWDVSKNFLNTVGFSFLSVYTKQRNTFSVFIWLCINTSNPSKVTYLQPWVFLREQKAVNVFPRKRHS